MPRATAGAPIPSSGAWTCGGLPPWRRRPPWWRERRPGSISDTSRCCSDAALAAAAVAWRGRAGLALGALAAGLTAGALAARGALPADLDAGRPVAAVGRVADHPRVAGGERRTLLALSRLRQGRRVVRVRTTVRLTMPDHGPPLRFGERLRVRGALRRSAGFANAIPVAPGPWRLRVKSPRLVEHLAPPGPVAGLSARLRRRVEAAWRAVPAGGGQGAALARALVAGDAGEVPARWRRGLRRSGLAHLLAVSGLHVALVAAVALWITVGVPAPLRTAAALGAVAAYLLLAGPRPSLLRAAAMAGVGGAALLARRPPGGANALAVVAAGLVLERPELVDDLGFRLTVAATAGILLVGSGLATGGRRAVRGDGRSGARRWVAQGVARPVAITLGAQLGAAPFALPAFHLVAWTAPLTNLAAVPWTAVALGSGLAWTALALASPTAAAAARPALDAVARPFGWPALGPPGWWGAWAVAAPPAVCWLLVASLARALARPRRCLPWLAAAALLLPALRWGGGGPRDHPGAELAVLDVGQGDALLLRDGARAVLVDGGGWWHGDLGGRVLLPALLGEGVARLDAAVLTHPDRDHCGGLVDIASYLPIGEVWLARGVERSGCGAELVRAVLGDVPDRTRLRRLTAGDRLRVGRWRLRVLNPPAGLPPGANDASLVLRASAGGRRVLLTGDVGAGAELRLVAEWGAGLRSDVLKVAHHGSRHSSHPALLAAVRPRLALVSAGPGNPYGHPAPEVLARFRARGVPLLRTDRDGRIRLAWRRGAGGVPPPSGSPWRAAGRPPPAERRGAWYVRGSTGRVEPGHQERKDREVGMKSWTPIVVVAVALGGALGCGASRAQDEEGAAKAESAVGTKVRDEVAAAKRDSGTREGPVAGAPDVGREYQASVNRGWQKASAGENPAFACAGLKGRLIGTGKGADPAARRALYACNVLLPVRYFETRLDQVDAGDRTCQQVMTDLLTQLPAMTMSMDSLRTVAGTDAADAEAAAGEAVDAAVEEALSDPQAAIKSRLAPRVRQTCPDLAPMMVAR